tara:strand:- start:27 stop:1094 length:1068 start_codon:yes stop_codon:yes gene_type:complete
MVRTDNVLVKKFYGVNTPCNAPSNNMYFTVTGKAAPCWKLPGLCDQWSEERSIMDIWKGDKFQMYRDALSEYKFIARCKECKKEIDDDVWPLAKAYQDYPVNEYPSLMELELSNQCNLECIMCSGLLSSGIRKNRDKLPPLPQIYTDKFVDQMRDFVPHLTELRFNGGEPFAQLIVLDICDMVAEVNPGLKINIATNGTVYSKRVRKILEQNNAHINVSIDSLEPEKYAEIRINGKLEKVFKNFEIYKKYCTEGNRGLSVMVNPMRNNWWEMINFVKFADTHQCNLWFNTILYPKEHALHNLPPAELKNIYDKLSKKLDEYSRTRDNYGPKHNLHVGEHLVHNQIKNWLLDSYVI